VVRGDDARANVSPAARNGLAVTKPDRTCGAPITPLMAPALPARLPPNAHDARRFMDASHNAPETEAEQKR